MSQNGFSLLGISVLLGVMVLAGCADIHNSVDYDRHQMSNLRPSEDNPSHYVFEAQLSPKYPDTEAGEEARMEWVATWMELQHDCPDGFEVLDRRSIAPNEPNRYRSDLRYEVACRPN